MPGVVYCHQPEFIKYKVGLSTVYSKISYSFFKLKKIWLIMKYADKIIKGIKNSTLYTNYFTPENF